MEIYEKLRKLIKDRKWAFFMTVCGVLGMLLIMISSLLPTDKKEKNNSSPDINNSTSIAADYRNATEKRLESFLSVIDGAGEVKVYLTVGSSERYVYASEGRQSRGETQSEEERKYVIIGGGGEKNALVETVETPEITGVVIACDGGGSAAVREQMYRAAAAALDIPSSKIFVTKLR
jgi:stage III sporulation protein AG